jgi:hypothetical protein
MKLNLLENEDKIKKIKSNTSNFEVANDKI